MYNLPILNSVMKWINAIPVPDMEQGFSPYKIRRMEKVLDSTINGLKKVTMCFVSIRGTSA